MLCVCVLATFSWWNPPDPRQSTRNVTSAHPSALLCMGKVLGAQCGARVWSYQRWHSNHATREHMVTSNRCRLKPQLHVSPGHMQDHPSYHSHSAQKNDQNPLHLKLHGFCHSSEWFGGLSLDEPRGVRPSSLSPWRDFPKSGRSCFIILLLLLFYQVCPFAVLPPI
jgi:hypothetical protein